MRNFTEKTYWDDVYKDMNINSVSISIYYRIKEYLKYITRDYSNFLLWEVLFRSYIPKNKDGKVIEIGCAPGKYLYSFHKDFLYEPYGIDYSKKGVEITKKYFVKKGLNKDNIIYADFFDPLFQSEQKNKYDIVFSRGFIEHFDTVKSVVQNHINMLKVGGYIVIIIPQISSLNGYIARFFNIDSYKVHNISIMNKDSFTNLFPYSQLEHVYCDYVGIGSIGLFNTNTRWKYILYRVLLLLQRPVDFLLRVFVPKNILNNKYTSPYLLFIGKKIV